MAPMELFNEAEIIRRLNLTADEVEKILHDRETTRFYARGFEMLFRLTEVEQRIKALRQQPCAS